MNIILYHIIYRNVHKLLIQIMKNLIISNAAIPVKYPLFYAGFLLFIALKINKKTILLIYLFLLKINIRHT